MGSVANVAKGTGRILSALYYRAVLPVQFKQAAREVVGDRSFPTTRLMLQEGLYNGLCLGRTGVKKMIDESYYPSIIKGYNTFRGGGYLVLLLSLGGSALSIAGIREATGPVFSLRYLGGLGINALGFTLGLIVLFLSRSSVKDYFKSNEFFKKVETPVLGVDSWVEGR